MLCELRGYGAIRKFCKYNDKRAAEFQDELGEWIADAINQKLNKDLK